MPIRFVCPQCRRTGRLPDGFPGGKIRCPTCKTISLFDGGGIASSEVRGEAFPAERAVAVLVEKPAPEGDTYALEEVQSPPEIKTPPRPPALPPVAKDARKESRKEEKPSGKPIALIAGAAISGAAVVVVVVILLLRPSGVAEQSAAPKGRLGGAADSTAQGPGNAPQPSATTPPATGQVANVARLQGNPGDIQPGTPRLSPAGPTPGSGPQGAQTSPRVLAQRPTANGGLPAGAGLVEASAPGGVDQAPIQAADSIRRIQEATVYLKVQAGRLRGSGTGFVIQSEGNKVLIATNDHVVNPHLEGLPRNDDSTRPQPQPRIVAVFRSGAASGVEQSIPAQIVAADGEDNRDLAILEVRGVKQPPQPIALSDAAVPELLMPLLIYGFPFGNIDMSLNPAVNRNPSITVNRGSVSSMRNDQFNRLARIQIDGSINPGNSGGPVVDEKGRLVGISVAKIANTNIGFAIPVAELIRMLDGRIGSVSLAMRGERGGLAELQVRVRLIDPLNHIQSLDFLYAPGSAGPGAGPDANGSWSPLPGAQTVSLSRNGATASATIQAPVNSLQNRRLMVQAAYRLDSTKLLYTMPQAYDVPSRPTSLARAGGEPEAKGPTATFAVLGPLIDCHKQPVKDCKLQRDANSLTIEVPPGVRLLSNEVDLRNAPMTLADVVGDFVAQVRVTGTMIPGTDAPKIKGKIPPGTFQGAGLLLWQDTKNYIRVERSVSNKRGQVVLSTKALVEIIKGGKSLASFYVDIPDGPLYLRLQRINGALSFLFGLDGRNWITSRKLAVTFPAKLRVGLVACNLSKQPLSAQFEEFVLITEKKDMTDPMKP
jgi:S1-C subfamily serine protease/regulation of enolase protein 1 (concanavalin A-like superfamily)